MCYLISMASTSRGRRPWDCGLERATALSLVELFELESDA